MMFKETSWENIVSQQYNVLHSFIKKTLKETSKFLLNKYDHRTFEIRDARQNETKPAL